MNSLFDNRELFIATMHGKEVIIGSKMTETFEMNYSIDKGFDSDSFGTFSGEIERIISPYDAALNKCYESQKEYGYDLVIASEGSFFMTYGFLATNHELLLLKDFKNDIEIKAEYVSHDTNFNGEFFHDLEGLEDFLERVKFPSHGLILRPQSGTFERLEKGITDLDFLKKRMKSYISEFGQVYLETDMRANFNPTRMNAIDLATEQLVLKMKSICPECSIPGFSVTKKEVGLPCELCSTPTKSVLKHVYNCSKCSYQSELLYPNDKIAEDPMYCDVCNP